METILRFKNKKFKIMLVGDPHCKPDDSTARGKAIIQDYLALQYAALEREHPDLVVLMGDNATGDDIESFTKTLYRTVKPYTDTNTPFAFVLGNHDLEWSDIDLDTQYGIYRSIPGCVMTDYTPSGDYDVLIHRTDGSAPALHLLFVYSGGGAPDADYGYYDHVYEEQNRWIADACARVRDAWGIVPAILFQHIPVKEEFELLNERNFLCMLFDGVTGQNEQKGRFYTKKRTTEGYLGEAPCTAAYNSGEFDVIKRTESIFAMFFGHDHMNDFTGMHDGILMGQCKTASFDVYGDGLMQGVRILELDEDAPFAMHTRMLRYRDFFGEKCRSVNKELIRHHDRENIKIEILTKALCAAAAAALPVVLIKLIKGFKK